MLHVCSIVYKIAASNPLIKSEKEVTLLIFPLINRQHRKFACRTFTEPFLFFFKKITKALTKTNSFKCI